MTTKSLEIQRCRGKKLWCSLFLSQVKKTLLSSAHGAQMMLHRGARETEERYLWERGMQEQTLSMSKVLSILFLFCFFHPLIVYFTWAEHRHPYPFQHWPLCLSVQLQNILSELLWPFLIHLWRYILHIHMQFTTERKNRDFTAVSPDFFYVSTKFQPSEVFSPAGSER